MGRGQDEANDHTQHRRSDQPDQSFSERQIYEQAMERLASEVAAVEKIDMEKAQTKLEKLLKVA